MRNRTSTPSAAQRLLVQGVVASTIQLVHGVRDGRGLSAMHHLMQERRRMLAQLDPENTGGQEEAFEALRAAVWESERTLETLIS